MTLCLITPVVVRQASWSSLYDVRADISSTSGSGKEGSPSVNLNYRANITQSTGENWEGVSLTLSTASPLLGSPVPKVQPWRIAVRGFIPKYSFGAVPSRAQAQQQVAALPVLTPQRRGTTSRFSSIEVDETFVDEGPNIQIRQGAIGSTFTVEGLSPIPSDGSSHKVSIAVSVHLVPVIFVG